MRRMRGNKCLFDNLSSAACVTLFIVMNTLIIILLFARFKLNFIRLFNASVENNIFFSYIFRSAFRPISRSISAKLIQSIRLYYTRNNEPQRQLFKI